MTLGRVGTETVDARRREAAEVIDRIKRGEDPRPAPPPTVADLAARWLAHHVEARCRPNTAQATAWRCGTTFSSHPRGKLAETWEMVPPGRNPCRHVSYYREKARERFLTPEEFRRLGAALRKFEAKSAMMPSAIAAVRLLMLTGCRCGEVLSLKWDDVDRTTRVLRLPNAKTGPCMVPLTGPVLKVLDGIEREEGVPWVLWGARPGRG